MGFDVKAYKEAMCNTVGCFSYSSKPDTKAAIKAMALVEGDKLPKIGDTIQVYDSTAPATPKTVILTAENYACNLYDWAKLKAYNCFDGDFYKNIWFFPQDPNRGLQNGTRPMWEVEYETIDDEELASPIGYKNTTKYNLNLLENQCWLNDLLAKKPKLSVIDFLDNGVMVLPYGTGKGFYENVLKKGGIALEDAKSTVQGSIEIFHRGKQQPCFYKCDDADYSDKIQKVAEFTFNRANTVVNGLTVATCGAKSACAKYTASPNTAFDFLLAPTEAPISTCYTAKLLDKCGEPLSATVASAITVNASTGQVTAPSGLPAGEYGFTILFENECCVNGTTCFTVTIA